MVDVALARVGGDDQAGHAQAIAVGVDPRGPDVVVEAAPVVPAHEDGGGVPVRPLHGGVDDLGHPELAARDQRRRMLRPALAGDHPADGRQPARPCGGEVASGQLHVLQLAGLGDVGEARQRVPDRRLAGALQRRIRADHVAVAAIRLLAGGEVVAPGHVVLVEQVGEIGPRIGSAALDRIRRRPPGVGVGVAAHRIERRFAAGRPGRHQEHVGGHAPAGGRARTCGPAARSCARSASSWGARGRCGSPSRRGGRGRACRSWYWARPGRTRRGRWSPRR